MKLTELLDLTMAHTGNLGDMSAADAYFVERWASFSPDQRLWASALVLAIEDWTNIFADVFAQPRYRFYIADGQILAEWLFDEPADVRDENDPPSLEEVCHVLGLNHHALRDMLRKIGEPKQAHKHLYDKRTLLAKRKFSASRKKKPVGYTHDAGRQLA